MGFSKTSYKILICFLLAPATALAQHLQTPPLQPLNLHARYTVAWNGISIGRVIITSTEDGKSYSMEVDTKTSGIGSLFSNEKRIATTEGKIAAGKYIPAKYDSRPQKGGEDGARHTTLIYDANGKVKSRDQVPTDDPSYRPLVTPEEMANSYDTVTGALVLRRALYEGLDKNVESVTTKTYDGSRLAEMKLSPVNSDTKVEIQGKYVPVITTRVTRTPINGYTAKELKKFKAGDPPIHLYFTADDKFWPVRVTVDASVGMLSATLTSTN